MPAIKIIDVLFLKTISAVDQRNVRFKSKKAHPAQFFVIAGFNINTVIFVFHNRVTQIAVKIQILIPLRTNIIVHIRIKLLKGRTCIYKASQFRVQLIFKAQTIANFRLCNII